MFYVHRNTEGQVVSLHLEPESPTQEVVAADHPDVLSFLGRVPSAATTKFAFDRMDLELIRVIEDLVNVLIAKNLVDMTDLPPEAQTKLLMRKGFRERLAQQRIRAAAGRAEFIDTLDDTKFGQLR